MKKVQLKDFLARVSRELPRTHFKWTSTVQSDVRNTIYADMYVEGGSTFVTNASAANVYGQVRAIRDIYPKEWVHKLSIKRRLCGTHVFILETLL